MMGNIQSQTLYDKDLPQYSYHEGVLKDAETGFADSKTVPTESVEDDEQYHSVEEGDSICSLTPERTRPESSSAENSSDTSDDNDDDDDECSVEDSSGIYPHERSISVPADRLASNTRMEANVTSQQTFQKIDSISPELENSKRRSSNCISPACKDGLRQGKGCRSRNVVTSQQSSDQTLNFANSSPFIPIQPSQDLVFGSTVSESRKQLIKSKNKMSISSECEREESVSSINKKSASGCSKLKWNGCHESSESDVDDSENDVNRKPCKKRKMSSKSRRRSRRVHHYSIKESDSVSNSDKRCQEKNLDERFKCRCDCNSEQSDSERECGKHRRKDKCQKYKNYYSRKRKRKVCSESSDSGETHCCHKRHRSEGHCARESDAEENEDTIESKNVCRHVGCWKNSSNNCIIEDADRHHVSQPAELKQLLPEETLSITEASLLNSNVNAGSMGENAFCQPWHTYKMGNQSLRNSHGKVIPVRLQSQLNSATSTEVQGSKLSERQSKPGFSNLRNTEADQQNPHSEIMNGSKILKKAPKNQESEAEINSVKCVPVLGSQPPDYEKKRYTCPTEFGSFHSVQENVGASSFKNVLSSCVTNNLNKNPLKQAAAHGRVVSNNTEHGSSFEAKMSPKFSETQTVKSQFQSFLAPSRRHMPRGKTSPGTAREKLKNLWSAAKKEIGMNLTSLISKVTPSVTSPDSNSPYWETFLSATNSSQDSCSGLKDVHVSQLGSSTTSPCRDETQAPAKISPLISQKSPQPFHPGRNGALYVSSSFSGSNESLGTSILTAQHNNTQEHTGPENVTLPGISRHSQQNPAVNSSDAATSQVSTLLGSKILNKTLQQSSLSQSVSISVEWHPQTLQNQVLNCRLASAIDISIIIGDISEQKTAGIVNWTDGALSHSVTSCSKSIAAKAGALMWASCNDYIESKGSNLEAPDVLTTPAGGRFDKSVLAVLHVVEPNWVEGDERRNTCALVEVYANCLRFANERLGLDSLSLPLVGDGVFPFDICVQSFFDAVMIFLTEEQTSSKGFDLSSIHLIVPDIHSASFAADLANSYLELINASGLDRILVHIYNRCVGQKSS